MRALILVAGAALTLAACGGDADDAAEANMAVESLDANNVIVDDPAMMNGTAMEGTAMDANSEANMIAEDLTTNTPDTNLANGM